MKLKPNFRQLAFVGALLAAIAATPSAAQAQGTAFTYQGRLNSGTNVATGSYDLRFALFDAVTAGAQQGNLLTNSATAVSNGLFTVTLDFGNQFSGAARWLEIAVRTNGLTTFTNLAPRQLLTPTPYAVYAASANATNLVGTVSGSQIAAGSIGATQLSNSVSLWNRSGADISYTAGKVGVGTSTPAKALDVTGTSSGVASGASVDSSIFVRVSNTASDGNTSSPDFAGIGFGRTAVQQAIVGGTFGNDFLDFYTGGLLTSPKMRIDFAGNVLMQGGNLSVLTGNALVPNGSVRIGSTFSSTTKLSIDQPGGVTQLELLKPGSSLGYQFATDANGLGICEHNVACGRFYIQNGTGNVGIGTVTPGAKLTVNSSGYGIEQTDGNVLLSTYIDSSGGWLGTANNYPLNFFVNNGSESMAVNTNGNVGIGTTSPTAHFHVNGGVFETPVAAALFEVQNCGAACASPTWTEAVRLMNTEGNVLGLVGMGFLTATNGTSLTDVPDAWIGTDDKASGNTHSFKIATQSGGTLTTRVFVNGATGNVGIGTNSPSTKLEVAGEVTCVAVNITSDRNAKEDFKPVNAQDVLAKVVGLPITEWQYKSQTDARHIGPMAQDFRDAFTLGHDEKHISMVDESGVALAAIQGLNEKLTEKETKIEELNQTVVELKRAVEHLTEQMSQLKQQ